MRLLSPFTLTGLLVAQGANAALLTDCNNAFNSISTRTFIENVQKHSCQAGCQPRPDHWDAFGKEAMRELVEDGAASLDIDEGKEAFVDFLSESLQYLGAKCGPKLEKGHGWCESSPELEAAMKCIDDNERVSKLRAALRLLPYMNADRCKKVADYFQSSELWDKSFPARATPYLAQCHEL